MLHFAAIFRRPFPVQWLYQVCLDEPPAQATVLASDAHELLAACLLEKDEQGNVYLAPEIAEYIKLLPFTSEQKVWHQQAAYCYRQCQQYLEAAWHLRQAGLAQQAAAMLLAQPSSNMARTEAPAVYALLQQFNLAEVNETTWIKLRLLAGELLESLYNLEGASEQYRQALAANDVRLKAQAFWRRGQVLSFRHANESLLHYNRCLDLLATLPDEQGLRKLVLIHRARLYMQAQHGYLKASAELKCVEPLLAPTESALWSDLSLLRGELCTRQAQQGAALSHYQAAWLAANEAQDHKRMFNTADKLAGAYREIGQETEALYYLQECLAIAQRTGNLEQEALFYKGLGAYHARFQRYTRAIQAYETAYTMSGTLKHARLCAYLCYDLTEVFQQCQEIERMFRYLEEGQQLAQQQHLPDLLNQFLTLRATYMTLTTKWHTLNPRQRAAVLYTQAHGAITNRAYRMLHRISPKQAERDLHDLVEKQWIMPTGKGRAFHYVIAAR